MRLGLLIISNVAIAKVVLITVTCETKYENLCVACLYFIVHAIKFTKIQVHDI